MNKRFSSTFSLLMVLTALYYPGINAVLVDLFEKSVITHYFLGVSFPTVFLLMIINVSALFKLGACRISTQQMCFAGAFILFILLSCVNDPEFGYKELLYPFVMILPLSILLIAEKENICVEPGRFISYNFFLLLSVCVGLILLLDGSIVLRASLSHLNANSYSGYGAYLLFASMLFYSRDSFMKTLWASIGVFISVYILVLGNSVGMTIISLAILCACTFVAPPFKDKRIYIGCIMLAMVFSFSAVKQNDRNETILQRSETLVSNTNSTLYDRLAVYKYAYMNAEEHFYFGAPFVLPNEIKTAHNIVVEAYLIGGVFVALSFLIIIFKSSVLWLQVLMSRNQAFLAFAMLYFFSLIEAFFRGRIVFSVTLLGLIALSMDKLLRNEFVSVKK